MIGDSGNLARLQMIDLSGQQLTPDERAFLSERRPGGVCLFGRNVADRFQVAELVAELRSLAGPDLLVAADQEGGGVIRLSDLPYPPGAMALGAADDPLLTRQVAAATGRGLRALGINVDFAPVADVNSNPANPVIADRSFGADPEHVARHVVAFVHGLQETGVAATVKHFPGHGDVARDSHLELQTLARSAQMLERLELPPFLAAIATGVAAVMSAHIVLSAIDPEAPATLSAPVLTGLLRDRLGFSGVVFTDALDMRAVAANWGAAEASVRALAAGADMPVHVGPVREHEEVASGLERALAEGRLDGAALAASSERLARLSNAYPARPDVGSAWRDGDDRLLDEAARRSLLLLGRLPRMVPGSRVLLVAAEAVRQSAATQATVRPAGYLAEALREQGVTVEELEYSPADALAVAQQARAAARGCDVVIFASSSRTALTADERELGRRVAASAGTVGNETEGVKPPNAATAGFVHVALWNPYSVAELPGPALVSFGWRERSARAVASALTGGPVTGRAPVPLRTFDDIER
ncbi:MAG: beta-N-acetylhexosaminidase [Trueperaceae bacterium]